MSRRLEWDKADQPDSTGHLWQHGPSANETTYAARDKPGTKSIFFGPKIAELKRLKSQQERQYHEVLRSLPPLERETILREARMARKKARKKAKKRAAPKSRKRPLIGR